MYTIAATSTPSITVTLSITEARRIGDLNIDLDEIEIIRWRRKVRDALQYHTTIKDRYMIEDE